MPTKYKYVVHFLRDRVSVESANQKQLVTLINEYYGCPLITADILRNIIYKDRNPKTRQKYSSLFQIERSLF